MIKTNPKKNKCKKAEWLSEEALQIAEKKKRTETNKQTKKKLKAKEKSKRYTHLNAEFQRIARRDKKVFLSGKCKEIRENNTVGKIRGLFRKLETPKDIS